MLSARVPPTASRSDRLEIMREGVIRNAASLADYRKRLEEASRAHRTLSEDVEREGSSNRFPIGSVGDHARGRDTERGELSGLPEAVGGSLAGTQDVIGGC